MIRCLVRGALAFQLLCLLAFAGGPLAVGGPGAGQDAAPMTWTNGVVNYRVDGGLFAGGTRQLSSATGASRVQQMFTVWSSVPTASITATKIGSILPVPGFTDGDVSTVVELEAVLDDCDAGHQSPVIFDPAGQMFFSIFQDPSVVGVASPCAIDASGHVISGFAMLNGGFIDGVKGQINFETTDNVFDEAITHELGHLLGLDHSQINVELLNSAGNCDPTARAGLPLMFPFLICNARVDMGLPKLSPDDIAWISKLYPNGNFNTQYGVIRGHIYFTDGISQVQGVNVIARDVNDPKKIAVSVVSGFLFTENPGQSVTGTNTGGDAFGSREPVYEGFYEIPVPAGSYTIEVERVDPEFSSGSSVGPFSTPMPLPGGLPEFWDDQESSYDQPTDRTSIVVTPGSVISGKDIIFNSTPVRFDVLEDESRLQRARDWQLEEVAA